MPNVEKVKRDKRKKGRTKALMRHLAVNNIHEERDDPGARVKELDCLYSIYRLAENPGMSLEEFLQGAVELIPFSFQHPDTVAARITFKDQEIKTKNFKETDWMQCREIIVNGKREGLLEVCYFAEGPEIAEGLFLMAKEDFISTLSKGLCCIIERRQAEKDLVEALKKAEREKVIAETIISAIGDGISIQDTDYRILFQNQIHKDMMGEHIDEYCYKAYRQNDSVCEGCPLTRSFKDGKSHTLERIIETDTGIHHFEITSSPLKNSLGKIILGIEVVRNITARRQMEQEIIKTCNLESLGVLAGGLAHDYNNLLTSIFGNIELTKLRMAPDEEAYRLLDAASNAAKKSRYLTQQLLTFSKAGAPIKEVDSIVDVLKRSRDLALKGSPVKCEYNIHEDLWNVAFDRRQMGQVFHNLLVNARDVSPSGGKILIRAENTSIGESSSLPLEKGKYVKISITDQGTGIDKKIFSRIFDPYFTTKNLGIARGVGLGLAICHSVVTRHGGYINVRSELGCGSTFQIYLPAQ